MQAAATSAFDLLGLADQGALFDQLPSGVDGDAIRQALNKVVRRVAEAPFESDAGKRQWLLAEAGRILLGDPAQYAAAIHLTQAAAPDLADSAALAHLRLIALWRSGNRAGVIAEADRLLGLPTIAPAGRRILRNSLRRWNLERQVLPRITHLGDFWPSVAAAKVDPIAAIRVEGPFPLIDRIGPKVAELQGRQSDDLSFLDRMRWGSQVSRYTLFMRRLATTILAIPQHQRTPSEEDALTIYKKMLGRIAAPDPTALLACIENGRSAMLVQAHAGLSISHPQGLPLGAIPYSEVSGEAGRASRPQDFHLATRRPDVAVEFAKLAKLMKKQPRIVRIFPDGPDGNTMETAVCGRTISIGRGAASLAFLGKAATFFSGSHWTGDRFEFHLTPGPVASDYAQKDDFEQAFCAFYAKCLEGIVLGPPEFNGS